MIAKPHESPGEHGILGESPSLAAWSRVIAGTREATMRSSLAIRTLALGLAAFPATGGLTAADLDYTIKWLTDAGVLPPYAVVQGPTGWNYGVDMRRTTWIVSPSKS
jgi:hypothetical protein